MISHDKQLSEMNGALQDEKDDNTQYFDQIGQLSERQ